MKIILSRKSLDSGVAKNTSPVVDDTFVPIPIPSSKDTLLYNDIQTRLGISMEQAITDLGIQLKYGKEWTLKPRTAHFDPDLDREAIQRHTDWKPCLGQIGAAQAHLENEGVSVGDVFLFFGWFKDAVRNENRLTYSKGDKHGYHAVYGYLEIGEIHHVRSKDEREQLPEWLKTHLHCHDDRITNKHNAIYVAKDTLTWNKQLPGAGLLKADKKGRLTKHGCSRSKWQLDQRIFKNTTISYHSKKSWKEDYFQSVGRGQEFVIEATDRVIYWAKDLVTTLQP